MKAFHAYDIRGIYNVEFNKEDVYKIGYFLPKHLKTDQVLVGKDVRVSSDEIFEYLAKGINDAGADVIDIGLATTPMVYYSTAKYGFKASVQITASHNGKEYNGLKISRENAFPVGYDTGLSEIERMMHEEKIVPVEKKGTIEKMEVKNDYLNFLKEYKQDYSNLTISIDCSNGMAALLIKDLLGNQPEYLYDELDGTFPNHEANPLIPENVVDLQNLVKEKGSDIGIIFDGDADRVMFVDEKGQFISPDLMIALMAHYFLKDGKKAKVLQDIRTSKAVGEYIEKFGSEMHMWRVGRAFAALKLREIDGLFGGELAGHYYFKDFYYSDSGLLACLIILNVLSEMKENGRTMSSLIDEIRKYESSGEINFRIEQKKEAMEAVKKFYFDKEEPTAFYDFDGYRIEYNDWWLNIRPSNTEPYLRLLVEANSSALLNAKVDELKSIIGKFK